MLYHHHVNTFFMPGHKYYNDTAKQGLAGFIQISGNTVTSKGLYISLFI